MSARLRVADLKASRVLVQANVCSDDSRFLQWLNSIQERALNLGRWFGTTQLMRFCASDGCLILPREVAVIEAAKFDGVPMRMRNQWYEFIKPHCTVSSCSLPTSYGRCNTSSQSCNCCGCLGGLDFEERDLVATYAFTNSGEKIRAYIGGLSDVGKKIILQGFDSNGVWVRTSIGGIIQDGEQITLANPFTDSSTTWAAGSPVRVIKDPTDYRVLMFAVDSGGNETRQIADYQPTETNPMYRRMSLPTECPSETRTITALASLQHIPLTQDNDWLLFTNLSAYEDGIMSAKYREAGDITLADAYFFGNPRPPKNARGVSRYNDGMGMIPQLEAELRKMTGDRTSVNVDYDGVNLAGFM